MNTPLPTDVYSPSDLAALTLEIREYAKWFGQYVNAQRAGSRPNTAQPELSPIASNLIRDYAKLSPMTTERIDEIIATLEQAAMHAPVITITLAAPAPSEVKKQLTEWCRRELSPSVLVAFRFNAHILGGMVVRVGSRVYDWSFRTQLMNKRRGITEALSRV